jgi:hypothetical protein
MELIPACSVNITSTAENDKININNPEKQDEY